MSAVTVTGSNASTTTRRDSVTTSQTKRSGNVATLLNDQKPLTAIDTFGNVFTVPDYSIKDILGAIPKHCYERRWYEGLYYVFRDIACMLAIGYIGNTYIPMVPNTAARALLWFGYATVQGLFGTGLWVLSHECGHRAFSDYEWLDSFVGWVLHSYLLVPFFSWKFSHGKHHKATGHLTRDMVFVPRTKEQFLEKRGVSNLKELSEDAPIVSLYQLLLQQLGGWIMYLFTDVTGQPYPEVSAYKVNHFNPTAPIFDKKDYWYVVLSDIGIIIQLGVLYVWQQNFGGWNVFINWFLPYIWVNHWLVFITFLQHSDPTMPHYDADQWNFARGAAATIDREFGFIGQHIFHDIIETHVLHHYCSRIPFYNAREASEAIKKVMGEHYKHSDENMWVSLWKSARWCQFVDGDNGVKMYRNINGFGVDPTN